MLLFGNGPLIIKIEKMVEKVSPRAAELAKRVSQELSPRAQELAKRASLSGSAALKD